MATPYPHAGNHRMKPYILHTWMEIVMKAIQMKG
jgi:hypothetical protein